MRNRLAPACTVAAAATLIVATLGGPLSGTAASARKARRVTMKDAYTGTGAAGGRGVQVVDFNGDSFGGAIFDPPGTFPRVSVRVADEHSADVAFVVGQDVDANGLLDWQEAYCTETDAPVEVTPDALVGVFVQQGPCADGTPAFGTTGTIAVTFIP